MEHESDLPNGGTDDQGDSDHQQYSIGRTAQPEMSMPPTVLVTEMDNGALILQGRPDGPRAYLSPADAGPLRRELARAFGSADLTLSDGPGEDL